jgi:predicted HD phosphohydrolase
MSFAAGKAREIIALLQERGNGDYIGERISQLEHCLQCAHLASEAGKIILFTIRREAEA